MTWTKVTRIDALDGSELPFISVSKSHFSFSASFARIADIEPGYRVAVYLDPDARKIGFEFYKENQPDTFALAAASGNKKGEKRKGMTISSIGTIRRNGWIYSVTKQPPRHRRFQPKKESGKWVISLCPAFEERRARESTDIPSEVVGIYRYLRASGEVVYIGRGNIRVRLTSEDRKEWDFGSIEYSVLPNPDEQVKWEDYWLERFKKENHGKLPFYNQVSGSAKHRE